MAARIYLILFLYLLNSDSSEAEGGKTNMNHLADRYLKPVMTIDKVSLTQRNYIQFLKYMVDVPPITDYTFCIWMKSNNLTRNHPLLSYSKDENDRLITVWVTPHGKFLRLKIMDKPVFEVPLDLTEHIWHHICQSWAGLTGLWDLYVNGKHLASGQDAGLQGMIIPPHGDLVVGQEYTDFDKGLDDGIEGDIFGFNMVLASTHNHYTPPDHHPIAPPVNLRLPVPLVIDSNIPHKAHFGNERHKYKSYRFKSGVPFKHTIELESPRSSSEPSVLDYFTSIPSRMAKTFFDMFDLTQPQRKINKIYKPHPHYPRRSYTIHPRRISNIEIPAEGQKPLGLLLVQLSYDCTNQKGAPLNGKSVLISWTKTGVRVFGGAALSPIAPFCTGI
ncbi:unnamed protein product [Acanthoscelides obtectus]|uniref:Pentraxin (PTX) domain-containing protein n=1 Tax=Acanthoscelides obtectus TaxID=200917 RepID=A0A9P0NXA8_ACAOB|nr:unnamed protein product [Acanthoscelides obtectus]CAK1621920.1 Neuronal pentraxin receptor [Acanthoscelides obtectus]